MGFEEIATKSDIAKLYQDIQLMFSSAVEPKLAELNDRYLTIDEAAAFTQHNERTVRYWISKGKIDQLGNTVKLVAEEFCPGKYRILKSQLIAFGKVKEQKVTSKRKVS